LEPDNSRIDQPETTRVVKGDQVDTAVEGEVVCAMTSVYLTNRSLKLQTRRGPATSAVGIGRLDRCFLHRTVCLDFGCFLIDMAFIVLDVVVHDGSSNYFVVVVG